MLKMTTFFLRKTYHSDRICTQSLTPCTQWSIKHVILYLIISLANLNQFLWLFDQFNCEEILHASVVKFTTSCSLCVHSTWENTEQLLTLFSKCWSIHLTATVKSWPIWIFLYSWNWKQILQITHAYIYLFYVNSVSLMMPKSVIIHRRWYLL